ncbi:MAG: hypothetical protein JOY78_00035 [Pseudonocardia sp.]|nr:hypothetical protein [Pseudonocardia sp.]
MMLVTAIEKPPALGDVRAVGHPARTGEIACGKAWMTPVGTLVGVRAGERGADAL